MKNIILVKKRIEETLNASIKQAKMDPSSSYIKCLLFNGPNLQTYFVMALQAQMEEHGCSYSDFYHTDGNKVYVKDVENIGFIRNITEASKKEVGYNFYLQHSDNLKVKAKHYKDAIGELIFRLTEISIHRYYYDEFIDKDKISNGDRFAFIPTIKEGNISRYLNRGEANKINAQFGYDLLTDIKGQTETTRSGRFGGVYAFSNRQIALLIPVIIENSVINKDGQIEIDPGLPRTLLAEASPTQEFPKRSCGEGTLTEANIQDQKRSSSIPSFRAWDSSTFLNSEDSLKDTENICNEEPEKQQVTDESDRKSSDEYSEAKSQDSKSPKKHGGGVQKIKNFSFHILRSNMT
ncbi:hypothetical protein [Wolbachia endosymbiont of Kradibia gibbosae]|uniref:hypothetical protein n=1 Tax=Wolbachia endosymbiont of Kradibia gibbosae TaxID=2742716 RepID=UPI001F555B59|nr:hypothetical protein [Wolbachia endosymbiont of Kradibia gibbosae]